jgi:hypothetical protein
MSNTFKCVCCKKNGEYKFIIDINRVLQNTHGNSITFLAKLSKGEQITYITPKKSRKCDFCGTINFRKENYATLVLSGSPEENDKLLLSLFKKFDYPSVQKIYHGPANCLKIVKGQDTSNSLFEEELLKRFLLSFIQENDTLQHRVIKELVSYEKKSTDSFFLKDKK